MEAVSLSRSLGLTEPRQSGEPWWAAWDDDPFNRCEGRAALGLGATGGGHIENYCSVLFKMCSI